MEEGQYGGGGGILGRWGEEGMSRYSAEGLYGDNKGKTRG
jgi:hypothetical protein